MAKNIIFQIEIRTKNYKGYLQTNDTTEPPKVFFVFIDNYIIGNLFCRENWRFEQVGGRFDKLTENERKKIADYLGNIAVEAYG